ncbi:MAG: hypothetical protein U9P50_00180 [Patescibacteria group bacterium]|nr:hypothetical protein [Patescibacteria group bacterium]
MEILPIVIAVFFTIFLNNKKKKKAPLGVKAKTRPKNLFENIVEYYKKEMERQQELVNLKKNKVQTSGQAQTPHTPVIKTSPTNRITIDQINLGIDIRTILFIPFLLVALSLFITKAKIGGTIMSTLHGWPYPLLNHQIKDVIDNIPINEWIVNFGSFYHYVIFDYLFYLVITIILYSFTKLVNRD